MCEIVIIYNILSTHVSSPWYRSIVLIFIHRVYCSLHVSTLNHVWRQCVSVSEWKIECTSAEASPPTYPGCIYIADPSVCSLFLTCPPFSFCVRLIIWGMLISSLNLSLCVKLRRFHLYFSSEMSPVLCLYVAQAETCLSSVWKLPCAPVYACSRWGMFTWSLTSAFSPVAACTLGVFYACSRTLGFGRSPEGPLLRIVPCFLL